MATPASLPCPYRDFESNSSEGLGEQLAALLEHVQATHGGDLPSTAGPALDACAKELRKLPV